MQVRSNGCILYFPDSFPQQQRYRGSEGFVVNLNAPLEREWCAGQLHKLEAAPKGAQAAPVDDPIAIRLIKAEQLRIDAAGSNSKAEAKSGRTDDLEVSRPRARAGAV